jgi:PAS domain-containing protein
VITPVRLKTAPEIRNIGVLNNSPRQIETRSEQAIRASELSYRRLFEGAKDGILILDVDTGRISDVNPFLVELLGFSRGEDPLKQLVTQRTKKKMRLTGRSLPQ